MKLGIIIYSNDPETVWNAFRFGNFAIKSGDTVKIFLLAKGVECESLDTDKFRISGQIQTFTAGNGKIYACGTCLKLRNQQESEVCPLSTLEDMYEIVNGCDKVLTF